MANSDTRGVRHVKCPRCQSVLQEPGVPVYQCGGCGATLRAKNRSGESPSRSSLPSQSRHLASGDVASTSSRSSTPNPDVRSSEQQATGTRSRVESGDLVSERRHSSGDVASTSSTPDATRSSRQHATAASTSRRESGDLVSARRYGSGDVASTSSTPDATRSSGQKATGMTSRCASGDLLSARRHGSGDVASTSSTPDATRSSRQHATTSTTSRCDSGDLVSARKPGSSDVASTSSTPDANSGRRQASPDTAIQRERSDLSSARNQVPPIERKEEHEQSTNRGVHHSSEFPSQRYARDAERRASSPGTSVSHNRGSKDATSELQADAEKRSNSQVELPDAARKKRSGDQAAVQPVQFRVPEQSAPKPAQAAAEAQPSRDAAPAVAGGKAPSPPRHELQAEEEEDLAPLRQKILKTVDELRGDLSELFRKSPDLNPTTTTRPRPPRLPNKQEGHAPRGAAASTLPARGARRHAAAAGSAARAMKPGQVIAPPPPPPRGLPSRRYRRCRADPCFDNTAQQPRPCHHGCCRHSSKPECSSCRGHCCRPVRAAQEPPSAAPRMKPPPAAAPANKRRAPPPRHHCRPVLKGAPFIVCSSCFKLVQVPADFAVATNRLRKLRCGACAAVLSYSYRDPARKKASQEDSVDEFSSDQVRGGGGGKGYDVDDPFAPFDVDAFGLSSYSTTEDDEQTPPLHVSRNTSFDTVDGAKRAGRLHRLMGYGSASELLLRRSPDLYESFGERATTPDYDRKGKSVCVDDAEDDGGFDDDSDDSGVLTRSAARGAVWPLPGQGAIRIKS